MATINTDPPQPKPRRKRPTAQPRDAYQRILDKSNKLFQSRQASRARYTRDPNAVRIRPSNRKRRGKKPGESSSSWSDDEDGADGEGRPGQPVFCTLDALIRGNSPLIVITSATAESETDYENRMHRYMPVEGGGGGGDNNTLCLHREYDAANKAYEALEPRVTLWPYQEKGVQFMTEREADSARVGSCGGMLCDEMGLGKTLQTLVHVHRDIKRLIHLSGGTRFNGVTLIIVPKIVCPTWTGEIARSFPPATFRYIRMMGEHSATGDAMALDATYIEGCCDLIFTTFDIVRLVYEAQQQKAREGAGCEDDNEDEEEDEDEDDEDAITHRRGTSRYDADLPHRYRILFQMKFRRVLIDEAHFVVNRGTRTFAALRALQARAKWMITGTPIQNSYANFLACLELIGVPAQWWSTGKRHSTTLIGEDDRSMHQMRSLIMLRRVKADTVVVGSSETGPIQYNVDKRVEYLDFYTPQERAIYLMYAEYGRNAITGGSTGTARQPPVATAFGEVKTEKRLNVTTTIRLMRQCCIDLRILRHHTLPGGILMAGAPGDPVRTTFSECLFRDDVRPLRHIDPQSNRVLETRASNMCDSTRFRYRSASSDGTEESIYQWGPYDGMDGSGASLDMRDTYSRVLYDTVYGVLCEWRRDQRRDPTLTEVQTLICAELYPDALPDGSDPGSIQCLMRQIAFCYEHLMLRVFPLQGTKIRRIIQCIREDQVDSRDKAILFSDSVCFLRLALHDLAREDIGACMISGGGGSDGYSNESQLARFEYDPDCLVLLSSLKVGSVGLNLPHANRVYIVSRWWNPQPDLQAEYRVQRIGQNKTVHIRYFVLRDTVEEYVLSLADYKQNLARHIIESGAETEGGDVPDDQEFRTRLFDFECTIER